MPKLYVTSVNISHLVEMIYGMNMTWLVFKVAVLVMQSIISTIIFKGCFRWREISGVKAQIRERKKGLSGLFQLDFFVHSL